MEVGEVSIPQSGFGAFEQCGAFTGSRSGASVSIPQSGFGAFEQDERGVGRWEKVQFQSLSRDSGRLNWMARFRRNVDLPGFNPSVGIRGV